MRITAIVALALQVLGFAGLADSFLKWRTFFEAGVLEQYRNVLVAILGPLGSIQFAVIGYLISCVGFFVAALGANHDHLKYLRSLNTPVPDDYMTRRVESVEPPEAFDAAVKQRSRFIAMRNSAFGYVRLALCALAWPVFLLWALYIWFFSPMPKRHRSSNEEITQEKYLDEVGAFAFAEARRDEATAFARWAGITTLSFVVLVFVCADFAAS